MGDRPSFFYLPFLPFPDFFCPPPPPLLPFMVARRWRSSSCRAALLASRSARSRSASAFLAGSNSRTLGSSPGTAFLTGGVHFGNGLATAGGAKDATGPMRPVTATIRLFAPANGSFPPFATIASPIALAHSLPKPKCCVRRSISRVMTGISAQSFHPPHRQAPRAWQWTAHSVRSLPPLPYFFPGKESFLPSRTAFATATAFL